MTLIGVMSRMGVYTFLGIYYTRVVGIPIALVGAALLAENVVRGVAMPVAGAISDRIGRKPVLLWAAATSALIFPAFYFVPGPISLFAWSVAIGISQAPLWPVTSALLVDLVPAARRQSVLSLNYTMIAIGYTLGVIPAGFLVAYGYGSLAVASAAGFVAILAIALTLRPPPTHAPAARASLAHDLARAPRDPAFLALAALALVFPLGIGLVVAVVPIFAESVGLSESQIGLVVAVNGPLLALFALPVNARIEKTGPYRFLPLSSLFLVATWLMIALTGENVWALALAVVVFTGGELIFSAALPAAVAQLAPDHLRGTYQGAWGFVFATTLGGALFASGLLREAIGWRGTWLFWAAATSLAGIALLAARPMFRRIADARSAGD